MGGRQAELPWTGTFHAIGAKLIRQYADGIGLSSFFTIFDRPDAADLMNLVRQDLGLSKQQSPFPSKDTCLAIQSFTVNSGLPLRQVLSTRFQSCSQWKHELRRLFRCYTKAKRRQHVLDYDDLLFYWAKLMRDPKISTEIRSRFDHVLVDEYQDTRSLAIRNLVRAEAEWPRIDCRR